MITTSTEASADPSIYAVSPRVTDINTTVGCRYFSPDPRVPTEHHDTLASAKLYCLMTQVHVYEQFDQSAGVNLLDCKSNALNHYIMKSHMISYVTHNIPLTLKTTSTTHQKYLATEIICPSSSFCVWTNFSLLVNLWQNTLKTRFFYQIYLYVM